MQSPDSSDAYSGRMRDVARATLREEGVRGFYKVLPFLSCFSLFFNFQMMMEQVLESKELL